jgi:hypothetical protein
MATALQFHFRTGDFRIFVLFTYVFIDLLIDLLIDLFVVYLDWQHMIITKLIGNNKWISAWIESTVELAGNERKRRAEKQKAPEARQKRARLGRRAAARTANRREKGNKQTKQKNRYKKIAK